MGLNPALLMLLTRNKMPEIFKHNEKKGDNPLNAQILGAYNRLRTDSAQKLLCHAPFKTLYFGRYGHATACCYNRRHVLGQYPTMSIKEIWDGKARQELGQYIKDNDLRQGCQGCEAQLLAGNFDAVKSRQYDNNTFNANGYPSVIELELSNTCNLECEMCSGNFSSLIRAKREKLPPIPDAYDSEFVNQLEEFLPYLEQIKFYGGEPFLIDIYYEIWERVRKINPSIKLSVQTNATVLNNRLKELMSETNFHINVSLDSLQKDNYERIRKNADFDRVMENIAYFQNYCKSQGTTIGISTCGMQQNWHEIPDFINYCNSHNALLYIHMVLFPSHCSLRTLPPAELKTIAARLQEYDFPAETPVQKKNRTHYFDFIKQVIAWSTAEKKVEEEKTFTPQQVIEALLNHIGASPFLTQVEKAINTEAVNAKFGLLDKPEYGLIKNVISHLDIEDYDTLETTVIHFERHSMGELLELARDEMNRRIAQ